MLVHRSKTLCSDPPNQRPEMPKRQRSNDFEHEWWSTRWRGDDQNITDIYVALDNQEGIMIQSNFGIDDGNDIQDDTDIQDGNDIWVDTNETNWSEYYWDQNLIWIWWEGGWWIWDQEWILWEGGMESDD